MKNSGVPEFEGVAEQLECLQNEGLLTYRATTELGEEVYATSTGTLIKEVNDSTTLSYHITLRYNIDRWDSLSFLDRALILFIEGNNTECLLEPYRQDPDSA